MNINVGDVFLLHDSRWIAKIICVDHQGMGRYRQYPIIGLKRPVKQSKYKKMEDVSFWNADGVYDVNNKDYTPLNLDCLVSNGNLLWLESEPYYGYDLTPDTTLFDFNDEEINNE